MTEESTSLNKFHNYQGFFFLQYAVSIHNIHTWKHSSIKVHKCKAIQMLTEMKRRFTVANLSVLSI